ncbi:uncharacterized protein PgNI_01781 [Pyricularia grisea]|uniref:Histone H4 n=1 Tax=Pyricularia grisea TaxID=148305 RepID=A0A6P8BJD7_PYRGI|nr:uncharacterized protein PgNI_01781 [Pyricularia grisea]TLD16789.1 hypothetical protein PgNI_01781 [Pyricularia grisea]
MPTATARGGPRSSMGGPAPTANMGPRIGTAGKVSGKKLLHGAGGKRHRKIQRDTIQGITKGDIRRLARRGGVKRLAGMIYDETREAMKKYLERILRDCVAYCDYCRAKTVTVHDVLHSLKRIGRPVYGFDSPLPAPKKAPAPNS